VQVEIDRGKIEEPSRCPRDVCASIGTTSLIHNRCEFADKQVIRLQETPDAVPDGQTPHTLSLSVYDELVDVSKLGDRLVVTGIFRSVPVRVNPQRRTIKSLFKTFLDVVHVKLGSGDRLGVDRSTRPAGGDRLPGVGGDNDGIDDGEDKDDVEGAARRSKAEMEAKIMQLGQRADIYEFLARSLAPSIWKLEDVKKRILLQRLAVRTRILREVVAAAVDLDIGVTSMSYLLAIPGRVNRRYYRFIFVSSSSSSCY
jgi:DNA replication licensing factor MCM4